MPITYKTVFSKAIADFNAIQNAIASKGSIPNLDAADSGTQSVVTTADSATSSTLLKTDVMPDEIKKYLVYPSGNLDVTSSNIGSASDSYYTVRVADAVPSSSDAGFDSFNRDGYEIVKIRQGSMALPTSASISNANASYSAGTITLSGSFTNTPTTFTAGWINAKPSANTLVTMTATLEGSSLLETLNVPSWGIYYPSNGKIGFSEVTVNRGSVTITPASTVSATKETTGNTDTAISDILLGTKPSSGTYYTIVSDPSASTTASTDGWVNSDDITINSGSNAEKYLNKATHSVSINTLEDLVKPNVTISQTASSTIQTSVSETAYYIETTGNATDGSVIARETHTKGYSPEGTSATSAVTISPTVTGSGTKTYIKEGSVSSTAEVTGATITAGTGLTISTTAPDANAYTLTPYATASSSMNFTAGYISAKGTQGTASSTAGTTYYIAKSVTGGATSYSTAPTGADVTPLLAQQKVVIPAGYYPNARTIYSAAESEGTQASGFTFQVTETGTNKSYGDGVLTPSSTPTSGYYDISATGLVIKGKVTASTPGYFASAGVDIEDEDGASIKVGKIAAATFTGSCAITASDKSITPTVTAPATSGTYSIFASAAGTVETDQPAAGNYYIKVNTALPTTNNANKISISATSSAAATAGYTPAGTVGSASDSKTITVTATGDRYITVPTGNCTVAGGALSFTNVTSSPSNGGAAKTSNSQTNDYVTVTVNRAAVTDTHTAGYIPAQAATNAIAADALTVKIDAATPAAITVNIDDKSMGSIGTATSFNATTGAKTAGTKNGSTTVGVSSVTNGSQSVKDKYMLGNISVTSSDTGTVSASIAADASGANVDDALESLYKRMLGLAYTAVSADA